MADPQALIKHVVVLMLENRSFDHILGYLGTPNGLSGTESNPADPNVSGSPRTTVSKNANWTGDLDIDPSHSFEGVNVQLFGTDPAPAVPPAATNQGFVLDYSRQPKNTAAGAKSIMKCFDPARIPVLATLAREFAVCDRWFSSVPSQTWPNRFFVHCASSGGFLDNKVRVYDMRTIYDNLSAAGVDWEIYFHDIPHALTLARLRSSSARGRFKLFNQSFDAACRGGTLPAYSFIEPRYFDFLGLKANDQHPPHDIRRGEELIAKVYESIRNSQVWQSTVLIITYDEHGGIYDHVLPPACAAPNFAVCADPPFDFKRLGLRVPAVVVSPYIPKGMVDSAKDFDHTSILASAKVLFDLPFLTERDGNANTLWHLLSDTFRPDTPKTLPRPEGALPSDAPITAGTMSDAEISRSLNLASREPLSEFQQSLVALANDLEIPEPPGARAARIALDPQDEHTAAVHVRTSVERYLNSPR